MLRAEIDWTQLADNTPAALRWVLKRSLTREPKERLHDIADARIELGSSSDAPEPARDSQSSFWQLAVVAALALALGVGVANTFRRAAVDTPREPQRFVISAPRQDPPLQLSNPIVSADGRRVVYRGGGLRLLDHAQGEMLLYLREISDKESRALPGTSGAQGPFFSPDGLWVGFFSGGKLRKISVRGGTPIEICDASSDLPGGQWAPDGSIWFTPTWTSGFVKVSADGGALTEVTSPNASRGETGHWWPDFLPDGKTVLFTITTNEGFDKKRIGALDTSSGTWRDLFAGSAARYVPSGHVVYYQSGIYQVAPFDLSRLERTGPAVPALKGTRTVNPTGGMTKYYVFSSTGVL